jgi:GT2 family glycosyltransferase
MNQSPMPSEKQHSVSRNEPCPCGSGKRYKLCCGSLVGTAETGSSAAKALLHAALSHQQAGALKAAEDLYRRALAIAPDDPDGLHMLGAICYQTGRAWEAFELIDRALALTDWKFGTMRYNMGLVIAQLMRDADAGAPEGGLVDGRPRAAVRAASEKLEALARASVHYALYDEREPLAVPCAPMPRVSIVIPAFDQHRFTYSCIRSIALHTEPQDYEIVVVDDASREPVSTALAHVGGARIIRNDSNLGFIGSCNRGAAVARGEVLVFLNNDTLVTPGWLASLLDTLREPQVGLVGAKLVFPDGTLQEAGGIVWRNGSASNVGRNDDPGKPAYNYVRDVDYCSGACIAVRRAEFLALGGFDSHFAPAYYEDVDLAMRMRAAGKRVVYQPAATVVHFEGATSGRDLREGVKRHQIDNQVRFHDRWRDVLANHRESEARAVLDDGRNRRAHVLVVEAYLPVPDKDAGSVRILAVMRLLVRAGCKVTFVAQSLEFVQGYAQQLQQCGIEVLHFPYVWSVPQILSQRGDRIDLVWISRYLVAASLVDAVRRYAPEALFVFDTVDLHYLRESREAQLKGGRELAARAALTQQKELDVVRSADVTLVVSDVEREILAKAVPDARVLVLSTIHDVRPRVAGFAERRDIFFVGSFNHPPNADAVIWYAHEVWPLVRARLPGVRMFVIGSGMPPQVAALAGDGIETLGHVPDLEPYLGRCRLSVAPLRFGAGVKGKINAAQARAIPVVATNVAVEGMRLEHGRDVLVADSAEAFADAIVKLYSDEALWTAMSDAGMLNVARHFSPEAAAHSLEQLLALAHARRTRRIASGRRLHDEVASAG